jgi:signal transduction histidine kinase
MVQRIGIQQKLSLLFFVFFLIFSGTVGILLFNVQRMVETTENIVAKNNKINTMSEILLARLLDMDANHKKLIILKKEIYSEYFIQAKTEFEQMLVEAVSLSSTNPVISKSWAALEHSYARHKTGSWDDNGPLPTGSSWVTQQVVSFWLDSINKAKTLNQQDIESTLRELNERSRVMTRSGLYGFCVSILVGIVGIWFLTRAIFIPLTTLAEGLKRVAIDKQHQPISLKGGVEFNAIAKAYNNMSHQLNEEENLRNEFIATLSHEIRTPLSSIRESVNMIIEEVFGPVNDRQAKFLKIASVEIQRINNLLNYLLNVSVLESGARKKNSSLIDIRTLVKRCTESFASFAEKKKVAISIDASPSINSVYGVHEELQQVFINIVGNAIKFSKKHGSVNISWTESKNSKFVLFRIKDTGPGIAPAELPMVFSKYYRTKDARDHLDGVGLGLAISKKIVLNYGGEIGVTNNHGPGCTFYFSLPSRS